MNRAADLVAAEAAATSLLLQQRLHHLHFDVAKLRYEHTIYFDSMQSYCAKTRHTMQELARSSDTRDGLTLRRRREQRDIYIVLYNAEIRHPRRRNFTLAHEVGHICLRHTADGEAQEQEANAFAAQLLLPRILLRELVWRWGGRLSADEVCGVFGVSHAAAALRLRNLHSSIPISPQDRALLRRFGSLLPQPDGPIITV